VWRGGLVVVLVLGVFVVGCGGHRRVRGTIVFTAVDARRVAFYGIRPDGTGLPRLPPGTAPYGTAAAWSPDGRRALVAGDKSAYIFDRASGVRQQIRIPRLDPGDTGVAPWSPDGEHLLLSTDVGNVVLDVKTGAWHAIATPDEPGEPAVWSGDGKQILFASGVVLDAAP
jgi:WD40-like Beta Propeller Repeat